MLDKKVAERIDRALNFQETDQVPVCDFLHNKKVFHYFSHTNKNSFKEKAKAYHGLGVDICWRFERRSGHRFESFWRRLKKMTDRSHSFAVLSEEELKKEFDDFKEQQKIFEPYTYLAMSAEGCLSVAYRSLGIETFINEMYSAPIEVERMIDVFAENLYLRASEFAKENLGKLFFITDTIGYEEGLIFSETFLRRHWMPRIKQAIEPLKDKGIKVILHSPGNINDILDDLIGIGIDGIHPVDGTSKMDLGMIKKIYAKSLLLFGNIILAGKNEHSIIAQTKNSIQKAAYGGGFFIGTQAGIFDDSELANVFTFFNAIKDYSPIYPPIKTRNLL